MKKFNIQPHSAVLAITYRCNARCKMCNIWKNKPEPEIAPEIFARLPKSLNDVNITGGEPFLRADIVEILDAVFKRSNPAKLVISSNGFLMPVIIDKAKEILKREYSNRVTIAFSMDGIGKMHGEIRGIPDAFEKVEVTIKDLKKIGFKNIGIGYTFMTGNENEYMKVFEYSKKNDLNFGATIAHNAENYFATQENQSADYIKVEKQVDKYINRQIHSLKKADLGKCYFVHGLAHYAKTKQALVPCDALFGSFFMDPKGNVYPCNILTDQVGNLTEANFDDIWLGERAMKVRKKTTNCPTPCWMVCTAKPGIKKHWLKTGLWLIKEKIKRIAR